MHFKIQPYRISVSNPKLYQKLVTNLSEQLQISSIKPVTNNKKNSIHQRKVHTAHSNHRNSREKILTDKQTLQKLFLQSSTANFYRKNSTQRNKFTRSNRRNGTFSPWQLTKSQQKKQINQDEAQQNTMKLNLINKSSIKNKYIKSYITTDSFVKLNNNSLSRQKTVRQDFQEIQTFKTDFAPFKTITNFYQNKKTLESKRKSIKLIKYNKNKFQTVWNKHNYKRLLKISADTQNTFQENNKKIFFR